MKNCEACGSRTALGVCPTAVVILGIAIGGGFLAARAFSAVLRVAAAVLR